MTRDLLLALVALVLLGLAGLAVRVSRRADHVMADAHRRADHIIRTRRH